MIFTDGLRSGLVMVKKKKSKKPKQSKKESPVVLVATVNNSGFTNEYTTNAKAMVMWMLGAYGVKAVCKTYDSHPISLAREEAIEEFLNTKHVEGEKKGQPIYNFIFFMDSDSVPQADIVYRLLQHDVPVASGWYSSRGSALPVILKIVGKNLPKNMGEVLKDPEKFPKWQAMRYSEFLTLKKDKKGLVKVDGCGAGALLIRYDVLSHLDKPYFYEDHLRPHSFGEDLWFGLNCKIHGIDIKIDTSAFVGHWAWGVIGMRQVQQFIKQEQMMEKQKQLFKIKKDPM